MNISIKTISEKITNKIVFLSLAGILFLGITLSLFFVYQMYNSSEMFLTKHRNSLLEDYDLSLKEKVQTVVTLIETIHQQQLDGKYTQEEAKLHCANLVRELRYGKSGYFWIDTKKGVNVVLLGQEAEGKNRLKLKDAHGKFLIKELIAAALAGGDYVDYYFPKKGEKTPLPKRGYTQYFEPYCWVIGTGNYIDDIDKVIAKNRKEIKKMFWQSVILLLIVITIVFIIGGYIAFKLGGKISKPIIELSKNAEAIAKGNLSVEIDVSQKDEVGKLANSFKTMISELKNTIGAITESIENVSRGSEQISFSAQEIAQGSNEQAASAEEISSSIEQINATINQNTDNAQETEKIALKAAEGIKKGQKSTKKTLSRMLEISEQIMIINKIAEKTDLLAINAAIEASKAGVNGKGFAVVAGEIRQLAEISQKSAIHIIELTNASVKIAKESNEIFSETAPNVQKTAKLVQEIAAANTEQLSSINQITQAIMQFNSVVQQNSSTAEQLSAGSEELASQASSLNDAIEFFKLTSEIENKKQLHDEVIKYVSEALNKISVKNIKEVKNLEISFKQKISTDEEQVENTEKNGIEIELDNKRDEENYEKF